MSEMLLLGEGIPPLERFNRSSYWLDMASMLDRSLPVLTNLPIDVQLLTLIGIRGNNILYVTDDAEKALEELEHFEKYMNEPVRVIVGDPFEVAKEYRRKLGAFFYAADEQPSVDLHKKLLHVALNGRDMMSFGYRLLPGSLPPDLRKLVDQMTLMGEGLRFKGSAAQKEGVSYFTKDDQASIDFMMSISCQAYKMGGKLLYLPLRTFVKGPDETSETGRVLRHAFGGFVIRKNVGESSRSFMRRYMTMSNFTEVSSGSDWAHILKKMKELVQDSIDMPSELVTLDQMLEQFSLILGVQREAMDAYASEYKLRRFG